MNNPAPTVIPRVNLAGIELADVSMEDLVSGLLDEWQASTRPVTAFALHIGGLREHADSSFVSMMNSASVTYADGMAAVVLARCAGAHAIQRSPTTDLGWVLMREATTRLGSAARVAFIGGAPGLAVRAARSAAQMACIEVVCTSDGYRSEWATLMEDLNKARPDIIFVGLGMPLEAEWVITHQSLLPRALVVTCGGWFSFLAGEEKRAPKVVQAVGFEWTWRLVQHPRRLLARYVLGAFTALNLGVRIIMCRLARRV